MSDANLLGTPAPFSYQDRTYQLVPLSLEGEPLYQRWLEREAYVSLAAHRKTLGEEAFAQRVEGWSHDLASKTFAWGGRIFWQTIGTKPGLIYLAFLCLKAGEMHGGAAVDLALVEQMARDSAAWKQLRDLVVNLNFPNEVRPEPKQ